MSAKFSPYLRYLRSARWQTKRRLKLAEAGHRCQRCGSSRGALHVHHLTYERLTEELMADLQVLCEPCHHAIHNPSKPRLQRHQKRKRKKGAA